MGKRSVDNPVRCAVCLLSALLLLPFLPAANAQSSNVPLMLPSSVAYDTSGNLYFSETANHIVRRLTPAAVLTVIAGTGTQGFAGDTGPAIAAQLDSPTALALDGPGDLFIADTHNHRIRRVDVVTGIVSTYVVASLPVALAFNPQGVLVYADAGTHQVLAVDAATGKTHPVAGNGVQGFSGDGGPATAAAIDTPYGLAFDAAGNLYLADTHNHRIRRVDGVTGTIATVAGTGQPGFSGDRMPASASRLDLPRGLAMDATGNLFVADSRNHRIRRIDALTGSITSFAGDGTQAFLGDGSPAPGASLDTPQAVALSPAALPVVADSSNQRLRQVDSSGDIQTIAGVGAISPARTTSATQLLQTSSTTLTTTVTGGTGTPVGTVTLLDGTTPLSTTALVSGSVTLPTASLSAGSHTLTAAYSGDNSLLPSTSLPLLITIGNPGSADFTLIASSPSTVTVPAGSAASFSFTVALTGVALTSPVDLSVTGAPAAATSSFSPVTIPPLSAPSTFTLTIDTPASVRLVQPRRRELQSALLLTALVLPFAMRRRRIAAALPLLLLLAGCGARVNAGNSTGRQPVSYNITVSANATGPAGQTLLHTAQVTLVVD